MSVYQEKDKGTWRVVFRYTDFTGERKQTQKRGFKTKREATAWEHEMMLRKGNKLDMTFESFYEIYSEYKRQRVKESTFETKSHIVRTKILPYFGKRKISEITVADVIAWQNEMMAYRDEKGKPYSVDYLKTIQAQLTAIFNHAVNYYNLPRNPARQAGSMGKEVPKEMKFWTKEQYLKFAEAMMDKPRSYYAFEMLYWTGIREGECTGLTWNDIDFKKRCISVNHAATYYTRNGVAGFAISRPKTEAGIRQIPMMDAVYNALKNEYDRQKKDGFCTYELDGVSGFIFSNKLGLLHNPHCVNLAIKRIYEAHNAREIIDAKREHREPVIIPHFSCHVLRHTFCSRLCESDMNVKVIQEIMGHKNVETTLDIYTEVNYNKKKDSLEELASKMQFF